MKGKIVLITGATSGIGKETAIGLAKKGAQIVFTTRNEARGKQVKQEIIKESGNENIDVLFCDLSSLESVRKCCAEFIAKYDRLDVLLNNAGTWNHTRTLSKDGIENIFAVNVLAPFLMTNLLLPVIKKSSPSRIITVTSGLHQGTIQFDDIEFKNKKFSSMKVYRQSKLGVILFTRLLAKKLEGSGVTVNCIHPGMVKTNLGRDAGGISKAMFKFMGKDVKTGAATSIHVASSPEGGKITGEYWAKSQVQKATKESYDMEAAEKLWKMASKYVDI